MDERLEKALEFSNYMITLSNQKNLLKEKFYEEIVLYTQGAQFTVTKDLINFVNFLLEREIKEFVIIDDNDLPIKITNLEEFLDNLLDTYFSAANEYFNEYEELKKQRSVEKLVNYEN